MSNSVKVAVRVRPFNKREKNLNAKCCIEMQGQNTYIWDLDTYKGNREKAYAKKRTFTFDYSYWSHNSEDDHYASNNTIFEDMGHSILEQCWEGFNVSLFAYGQTGAGKSYSMVGYGEDKGLIPQACTEIFRRIEAKKKEYKEKNVPEDKQIEYEVKASMIEIYNEKIRDLFNHKNNPPGGLKVRENPKTGPYVDGLTMVNCYSSKEILHWLDVGNTNKTIGSTKMNATSSRAHTLFTIYLKFTTTRQMSKTKIKKIDVTSKLNLVDLAGSEKLKNTGNTGKRMKEGININKSLSALGNCIKALADLAEGKKTFVPFRDSVLTRIMKESLGGNSKTIMIAALSPASSNYIETLGTLRYANRAKKIKTKAIKNEDEREKKIRLLTEEVKKLKILLIQAGIDPSKIGSTEGLEALKSEDENIKNIKSQLVEQQKLMSSMDESEAQKKQRTNLLLNQNTAHLKKQGLGVKFDKDVIPYIQILNEDSTLGDSICYPLNKSKLIVGRMSQSPEPNIPLSGLGIKENHCFFHVQNSKNSKISQIFLLPGGNNGQLFLNGLKVNEKKMIHHNDRLIIGGSYIFKVIYIKEKTIGIENGTYKEENEEIDYEFASRELTEMQNKELIAQQEEMMQEKMKILEEEMEKKKNEAEKKLENERKQLEKQNEELLLQMKESKKSEQEKMMKELEKQKNEFLKKQKDLETKLQKEKEKAQERIAKETEEKKVMENNLLKFIPMIKECNFISEELKLHERFEIKLIKDQENFTKLKILAINLEKDQKNLWDTNKFIDRMYRMKEIYEDFVANQEAGLQFSIPQKNNPFQVVEKGEAQMIGTVMVFLRSLSNNMGTSIFSTILDYKGKKEGELKCEIIPCHKPTGVGAGTGTGVGAGGEGSGEKWKEDVDEELFVVEPSELLNQSIYWKLKIPFARGLSKKRCSDSYIQFKLPFSNQIVRSKPFNKSSINPDFQFEYQIETFVTQEVLNFFNEKVLTVEVWAAQDSKYEGKEENTKEKTDDNDADDELVPLDHEPTTIEEFKRELARVEKERLKFEDQFRYTEQQKEEVEKKLLLSEDEISELKRNQKDEDDDDDDTNGKENEKELKKKLDDAVMKNKQLHDELEDWKKKFEGILEKMKKGDDVIDVNEIQKTTEENIKVKNENENLKLQIEKIKNQLEQSKQATKDLKNAKTSQKSNCTIQ